MFKMQLIVLIPYFFAFALLTTGRFAKAAEDWLPLPVVSGNVSLALDKNSLAIEGSQAMFWERAQFERAEEKDEVSGRMITSKRVYRVMNCANRTQGVLRGSLFGENGKLIESIILLPEKVQMEAIPAGSVAEYEFNLVCGDLLKPK